MAPGPGGSMRPRAKMTSIGGHSAARAAGAAPGAPDGSTAGTSNTTAAAHTATAMLPNAR